jgi:hypothetical protein
MCEKHHIGKPRVGRIDDPETDGDATDCPGCPGDRFPTCKKHRARDTQWKCERCCSIGVRIARSRDPMGWSVWYCDICHDSPGRADVASKQMCKGN